MVPLKKYADFSGRASVAEFWTFFLFVLLANAAARLVDALLGRGLLGPVAGLIALALIVPQVAVTVRRLHDINKSGRELVAPLLMLAAAPLVYAFSGFIAKIVALGYAGVLLLVFANLLLMLSRKGSNIPNKYGKSPVAFSFGA